MGEERDEGWRRLVKADQEEQDKTPSSGSVSNNDWNWLVETIQAVLTIKTLEIAHMKPSQSIPQRSPKQKDQYAAFLEFYLICSFDDINQELLLAGPNTTDISYSTN